MKSAKLWVVMLALGLFLAPEVWAQAPPWGNQNAASPVPSASTALVPRLIKFTGTLFDAQTRPMTGPVGVTFALYAQQSGGAALWIETQNVKPDANGQYTVLLGAESSQGVPAELFATGEARWLGIQLERQAEQPRVLLVSVPYALKAGDAETVGGMPASAFVLATPNGTTSGASASGTTTQTSANSKTASKAMDTTKAPAAAATIGGGGNSNFVAKFDATGVNVINSSISDNGSRITAGEGIDFSSDFSFVGNANPVATGRVQMFDQAFVGFVIRGLNVLFETLQGSPAVPTEVMRVTQAGNVGIGTTTPSAPLEVDGPATDAGTEAILSQGGSSTGTNGIADDGIDPFGGSASGPGGSGGFGVFATGGNATATGGTAGDGGDFIAGTGSNGAFNGFAGFFGGDIHVTGAITAAIKDFKIDHPLDPGNKYLVHASVESSEMKNIYDGVVALDASGAATVQLPGWFEVLNKDFRYQLTAVGAPGPNLYIAQEIQNGRFAIAGGQPGMKVSWQVTGVRQDAFAEAHPLIVEVDKPQRERGYYIHPELYGAPTERGIEWARSPQLMKRMNERRAKQAQAKQVRPTATQSVSHPVANPLPRTTKQ